MKNKNIAITGYRGVIGKKFIKKFKNNKFKVCKIDITKRKKVFKWVKNSKFEIFIHLAALLEEKNDNSNHNKALNVNYNGTKNIVDAINKYKENSNIWFFFSSSSHVYSYSKKKINEKSLVRPINNYGKTKLLAEKYLIQNLKSKKLKLCVGRIFSIADKNQKKEYFIPYIYSKIKNKTDLIFKGLNKKRDFIHVDDILNAINYLYKKKRVGIYNIGSGKPLFLKNIVKKICKSKNFQHKLHFSENRRKGDLICDNRKLKSIGWKLKNSFDDILYQFN